MKTKYLLAGIGITVTAVLVVQLISTRRDKIKKKVRIANEGYETAEDILYPRRSMMKLGGGML